MIERHGTELVLIISVSFPHGLLLGEFEDMDYFQLQHDSSDVVTASVLACIPDRITRDHAPCESRHSSAKELNGTVDLYHLRISQHWLQFICERFLENEDCRNIVDIPASPDNSVRVQQSFILPADVDDLYMIRYPTHCWVGKIVDWSQPFELIEPVHNSVCVAILQDCPFGCGYPKFGRARSALWQWLRPRQKYCYSCSCSCVLNKNHQSPYNKPCWWIHEDVGNQSSNKVSQIFSPYKCKGAHRSLRCRQMKLLLKSTIDRSLFYDGFEGDEGGSRLNKSFQTQHASFHDRPMRTHQLDRDLQQKKAYHSWCRSWSCTHGTSSCPHWWMCRLWQVYICHCDWDVRCACSTAKCQMHHLPAQKRNAINLGSLIVYVEV